jgi:O-antigen ligase
MPFNTDPGIPLMWGVEIGIWALVTYVLIFLTSFKILWKQRYDDRSRYILISLIGYFLMSFTTNHTDTLLLPFMLFAIIIRSHERQKV